ncbi:retrotransposon protein, putative, ty1-copia subclass [Tanacetum coccineum]
MVRFMMNLTTLSLSFWDYALESATNILNMVPTKKVDKTPYELWYEKVPNLSYLKVWGCEALMKRDTPDKLQQRSVKCIFLGYPKETMGYYFYFPPKNKIVVAGYAEFFEKNLITQKVSGRAIDLEEIQDEDTSPSKITSKIHMEVEGFETPQKEVILIRRSERTHQALDRLCLNVEVEEHSLGDLNEPTSYKAATLDSESNKWIDAMNAEIQSMIDNMVWVLVDLPSNYNTIGTIKILISIMALYDYEIWKIDVKTAFLNGYLDEDIYMVQPKGFVDPKNPRKVCNLQRSIYGLKQASRSWNKRFDEEIKKFGFTQNLDEPCIYQKASGRNVTFLILYVDDIIIIGKYIPSLQSVKDYHGKCFAKKDLGEAAFILGIKIYRDRSKQLIGLSQSAYMDKILKIYRMDNSKRGHIPMQERLELNKTQGASTPEEVKRIPNVPYASATAVKNILKYLRNTKDMFLVYGGNPEAKLRVDCYCDAGFESDRDDIKSQTGYVFILNGGVVDWKRSKQSTTAMSATESKYIAASEAAMEAVWIRKFISGLGIVPTINEPIKMFCDNSAALLIANEPGVQRGARHYHRRYHYVRECIELGEINLLKVHTDDNLADPFTKALPKGKLTQHARSIGLRLCLESANNISQMFQHKVDNAPYELWYEKVPNLSYLKETMGYYFYFPPKNKIVVAGYAEFFEKNLITQKINLRNTGFETDRDDIKSQTGYVFVLNGGAVDWKSSKKSTTAMSATESKYIAASEAAMEAVWIRKFISGLGIVPTINKPIKMFCDNSAALFIANEPGRGAKHYHRRYHYASVLNWAR